MIRANCRGQRGAGMIGCLFIIIVVGGALYAGFMFAMPKLRHSSFEDRVNESLYNLRQNDAETIRKQLIEMAQEFEITLTPAQVSVDKTPARLTIHIAYEKPIDIKVWQTTLRFTLDRSSPL